MPTPFTKMNSGGSVQGGSRKRRHDDSGGRWTSKCTRLENANWPLENECEASLDRAPIFTSDTDASSFHAFQTTSVCPVIAVIKFAQV